MDRKNTSLSPLRQDRKRRRHPSRSRSPGHGQHENPSQRPLYFNARQLSRQDLTVYRPMFALYLDIQKRIDIDDLEENEVKGRWKSFVNKWNRGELAEGWYDPHTLRKSLNAKSTRDKQSACKADSDSDDDYGPSPPTSLQARSQNTSTSQRAGPSIPTSSDVLANREQASEDFALARQHDYETLQQQRRLDRKVQTSRLDDLTPRAEPGSKERQLEKKHLAASANRSFANAAHEAGEVELRDSDVIGEDGVGELKRMKKEQERKKNEREIRREEMIRARRAEREVKLAGLKEKEAKTMEMLKDIARARFGEGG